LNRRTKYFLTFFAVVIAVASSIATRGNIVAPADESETYQFRMGEGIRRALLDDCDIYLGTITRIEGDTIDLTVERSFKTTAGGEAAIELKYTKPRSARHDSEARSPWDLVTIAGGQRLFVSLCHESWGNRR